MNISIAERYAKTYDGGQKRILSKRKDVLKN